MPDVAVRPAVPEDLPALTAIYAHQVRTSHVTFDEGEVTVEDRRPWLAQFASTGPHRLLVVTEDGGVAGYAGSVSFRAKAAYRTSVETSVYVHPDKGGRGLGRLVYEALFEVLAGEQLHRAYGGIALPNEPSVRLHERMGFRHVGTYREVGFKFGKYWDVAWYEKAL